MTYLGTTVVVPPQPSARAPAVAQLGPLQYSPQYSPQVGPLQYSPQVEQYSTQVVPLQASPQVERLTSNPSYMATYAAPTNPTASYAAPAAPVEVFPAQMFRLPPQQSYGTIPDTNTTMAPAGYAPYLAPPSSFTAPSVNSFLPPTTDMNQSRAPPYVAPSTSMPVAGQVFSNTQGETDTGFSAPATIFPAQAVVRSIPATAHPAAPCTTDCASTAPRAIYAAPATSYVGTFAATTESYPPPAISYSQVPVTSYMGTTAATTESYLPPAISYSQVPPTVVGGQPTDLAGYAPPATNYLPPVTVTSPSSTLPASPNYNLAAQSEASNTAGYSVPQTNYHGAGSS